ncbi:MAG: tRNA (adenosine(37)-N6)-threonylcarbamoyltransferase complex ATPase subunit type 1 TsaE [Desulfobulbus sp.]|nr:tRNA (adenosine(37)-N6)-threonylcarbamoyltransferase complex ATPase subunit type 1 TsaE [Desulfobulbus sp.]
MIDTLAITCACPEDLTPLVQNLAEVLVASDVLLLSGNLGAGKTTLTQALAKALGVGDDQYVSSPSFALVHEYAGRLPVVHMDLYRLDQEEEIETAGLLDFFDQPVVCVVEWPDRLGGMTPAERLEILIEHQPPAARRLLLTPRGVSWRQRLDRIAARLSENGEYSQEIDVSTGCGRQTKDFPGAR